MKHLRTCAGVLAIAASVAVTAGERQFTQNVNDLKPGQCAAASYVYEQGELTSLAKGVTQVCTSIKGKSVWLTVDQKALEDLNY